ncbi:MAG TPA: DUF5990 family protein [Burkholderiaceae bacterium]
MDMLRLRLTYDGSGPAIWTPAAGAFGLQDRDAVLHVGSPRPDGSTVFEFELRAKPHESGVAVLSGAFAHGPPAARFLYLGWRNAQGAFAQRLKLPLAGIAWPDVAAAIDGGRPLAATLVDRHPRATSTGANIGGTRHVDWRVG